LSYKPSLAQAGQSPPGGFLSMLLMENGKIVIMLKS
jgi:hypothetical protein